MYFWNINALKEDIKNNRLSERQRFFYVLLFLTFLIGVYESNYLFSVETHLKNIEDIVVSIILFCMSLITMVLMYKVNNGDDFLGKYFSISCVVNIRLIIIIMPILILSSIFASNFHINLEKNINFIILIYGVFEMYFCYKYMVDVNLGKNEHS